MRMRMCVCVPVEAEAGSQLTRMLRAIMRLAGGTRAAKCQTTAGLPRREAEFQLSDQVMQRSSVRSHAMRKSHETNRTLVVAHCRFLVALVHADY